MIAAEELLRAIRLALPEAQVELVLNPSPAAQHALLLGRETALEVARFLRDDPRFAFDYLSNVTGVDWPEREVVEKVKVRRASEPGAAGAEKGADEFVEETRRRIEPGYLEAVYHLYSVSRRHGPVILRLRTEDRAERVELPSLVSLWRAAELQEREIFDLYGIVFTGHPDLRRLLMWEEFADHPMRRDYVEPDDYEYEPTAHDQVLARADAHRAAQEKGAGS